MKALYKFCLYPLIAIAVFVSTSSWGQTKTYTLKKKLSTNKATSFWNKPEHGIKLNPYFTPTSTTFTIKLEVTTADNIFFQYFSPCIPSPFTSKIHNAPLTMYATAANQSSQENNSGYINDWTEENPKNYYRSLKTVERPCQSSNIKPDTRKFFKNQAYITRYTLPPFNILEKKIDVNIKLTLTGDINISIINEIAIPGVDPLYLSDFIDKSGYNENHACASNSSISICRYYDEIRSIPNLSTTDMKIQAHRGIWGKNNQENTIGAMKESVAQGYKMLESDIMPYGVSNYTNPGGANFAVPSGLASYHDFTLERYSNGTGFIYDKNLSYLQNLKLNKPRSNELGAEEILFFDNPPGIGKSLIEYAIQDAGIAILVDMKTLESKGTGDKCTEMCNFQTQAQKDESLFENLKFAIEYFDDTYYESLRFLAIKTYKTYNELRNGLVIQRGLDPLLFDKVLWAPILADSNDRLNPVNVKKYLDGWFAHNESVLYYETNFFTDAAPLLAKSYCIGNKCYNVMEYIYRMSGRRAGIFSEEPVGGKGTVNRWGKWKIKNPVSDRRGDHLWLLKQPFFKHAVITTDRPDVWDQLND